MKKKLKPLISPFMWVVIAIAVLIYFEVNSKITIPIILISIATFILEYSPELFIGFQKTP